VTVSDSPIVTRADEAPAVGWSSVVNAGDARRPAEVEPAVEDWMIERRRWNAGWRRIVFPSVFLVYLAVTVNGITLHSDGIGSAVAYAALAVFCVAYVAILPVLWQPGGRRFWWPYATMIACWAVVAPFAHQDAFEMLVFVCVVTIAALPRHALLIVASVTVAAAVTPAFVPSWHSGIDTDAAVTIPLVSLSMYAFFGIIRSNRALTAARAEVARLAAENERTRIARDLHDLLGHSLTTITLKASLAHRLWERDPARAATEIAEVEALARHSLAEVRAAVGGYREVTFAGELATGREVLRAAGIAADLPEGVVPDADVDEVFGWAVREALTNVVRHARAVHCTIHVTPRTLQVIDDGVGAPNADARGNGLTGLTERVTALGGTVRSGPASPGGWQVRVEVPTA
jgi:two-component system sensor histidine kinase DesK